MDNPFTFDKPIEPKNFIGRRKLLDDLLYVISRNGSSIVTGQPRIGKSSLLLRLSSMIPTELPERAGTLIPVWMPSGHLDANASILDFWRHIVRLVTQVSPADAQAISAETDEWDYIDFELWFDSLLSSGRTVVLLIDGIGGLLANDQFGPAFWGGLRGMAQHEGLSLIMATRLTLEQLTLEIERKGPHGSPFLNVPTRRALYPFSFDEVAELIEHAIGQEKAYFTPRDKRIVWRLSGGHPFLSQLTSSLIWDARTARQPIAKNSYSRLVDEIIEMAAPHFWDTWRYLSPAGQTLGLMVALQEIGKHLKFNTQELEDILHTGLSLKVWDLQRAGLLEVENEKLVLSSVCFGTWILRHLLGPGREIPEPEEWLRENQQVLGRITRKQAETIAHAVGRVYSELRETALDLGNALVHARLGLA